MRTQALAAIAMTVALGVAAASAQNANSGAKAEISPVQTSPAAQNPPVNPQLAAQTPAANGPEASQPAPSAQTQPPSGNGVTVGTATINPTGIPPSQRNPLLADNGDVRISKLIGTSIYNKNDKKVGSVDDVLADENGQLQVVITTDSKKTVVPWNQLVFGDAKLNSDNKVLMPDATQNQLDKMQAFNYQNTNNNKK